MSDETDDQFWRARYDEACRDLKALRAEIARLTVERDALRALGDRLREEHQRLTAEARQLKARIDEWLKERKRLTTVLKACREALEVAANVLIFHSEYEGQKACRWCYGIDMIRAALARLEGK